MRWVSQLLGALFLALAALFMATPGPAAQKTNALILELEGKAVVSRADSEAWDPAYTNQVLLPRDRLRTLERSRAVVRLSDLSTLRLGPMSFVQMPEEKRRSVQFLRGLLYYFHRDKPGTLPVQTPSAYAVILGTEFALEVDANGATHLTLIDGTVEMTNQFGRLMLTNGEAAVAPSNAAPVKTPAIEAANVIQWVLYYPGVLDLQELALTPVEEQALDASLKAYRSGDLRAALTEYPANRPATSAAEKIYSAALLLSVGDVTEAQSVLATLPALDANAERTRTLAGALETLIAAVNFQPVGAKSSVLGQPLARGGPSPSVAGLGSSNATVLLAASYYQQAGGNLKLALALARRSAGVSPQFAFAWARVAELEFGFGRIDEAQAALTQSLALAPRNAQAIALNGFLFAAQNRIGRALAAFEQAIAHDGALGNAWLGRGLCRIRRGDITGGRDDLQVAATVEPQRSLLRSYLAKAFRQEGDLGRARAELELAQSLDPNDPTTWFYAALLLRDSNRLNSSVRALEHATELNDNRRVYRSRHLLDLDRAVQGVNLATIYADVGMSEVSAREAGRAVEADPANFAAHLFLGDSYQRLRDVGRVNQRFETAAITEYLLANLLAPVGAGTLAQSVTQNEYTKLFEADGLGVSSTTEYYSHGAWVQSGAQYGTLANISYALSAFYNSDNGQRANNDLEQTELSLQLKQQLTPADSIYLRVIKGEFESGDLVARQDPASVNQSLRVEERQEPLLLTGYHREWAPGVHTLALAGWLRDDLALTNGQQGTLLLTRNDDALVTEVVPIRLEQRYATSVEMFTGELQQLWQREKQTFIAGVRYQCGEFDTRNQQMNASIPPPIPGFVAALFPTNVQELAPNFERASAYSYYHCRPVESLQLSAGLSYDWLRFPVNFRWAPIQGEEDDTDQLSPKGGVIWTATDRTTLRAAYTRSLGGIGFDQSFRLEPTQVAGFNQAFRSLMPESLVGAQTAAKFESWDGSIEQRFGRGTYLGLSGQWLRSTADGTFGVFDFVQPFRVLQSSTPQRLDYDEQTLLLTLNQLVGDEWAFGARYRWSHAKLEREFTEIQDGVLTLPGFKPRTDSDGLLHQINVFGIYQHPSGFFTQADALWTAQRNSGDLTAQDEDFWQFNFYAGWRGFQRRVEVRLGVLNMTGQDYRLSPLNLMAELPRARTFVAGLKLSF